MRNSNERGWVRIWRKIEDHELWFAEPFTKAQAWIDLFMNANHKDSSIFVRGNEVVIKRGQLGWSEVTMAARWRWSKNKVRRFLKWLETKQQIEQQKSSLTTILTIKNYDEHQPEMKQQTIQQKDSRRNTNNNVKNENNDNKEDKYIYAVRALLAYWNQVHHTKYTSAEPLAANYAYWVTQYSDEDIRRAVENIQRHDYWKDKMTPTIFFRRKNPRGEDVDYIGEMLNVKGTLLIRPHLSV